MTLETYYEVLTILRVEYPKWNPPLLSLVALHNDDPYRILVATILSLRTKDETTAKAAARLFKLADTPQTMIKLDLIDIEKAIYPVGFYRNKAGQILELSKRIIDEFDGVVPNTKEDLMSFNGVGLKTANLVLALGFKIPAICVDVHVHRISNRIGFIRTKTPDESEARLSKKVPKAKWLEINDLFVALGQTICKPVSPICSVCPISHLCEKVGVKTSR